MTTPPRPSPSPRSGRLSVVVPSVNGVEYLAPCLDALRQAAALVAGMETIVVDRCGPLVQREIRERYPEVVLLPVERDTTIPDMRALAFRHARGEAVAVIEDHVLVEPDWGRRMLDALDRGLDVVGGAIVNDATERISDWAAYLCEYSHMLVPQPAGPAPAVTGNNVVYRRRLLERYRETIAEGRWEDHLHAAMRRDGVTLSHDPGIRARHRMHYRPLDYVAQRFLYSRAFAGMRRADLPVVARAARAAGALVLPPVLLARIAGRVRAAGRHRREWLASLPLLAVFVCAWAAGEALGYAVGPGRALARVR